MSVMLPVKMSILGVQDFEGTDPDQVSLLTDGVLELTDEGIDLTYEESAITGMEGTITKFQIRGSRVTLTRTGSLSSQMVFQQGRRHISLYQTPYGSMEMSISTSRLFCDLTEAGGRLEIDYSIELDHVLAGRNGFRIQVKPQV